MSFDNLPEEMVERILMFALKDLALERGYPPAAELFRTDVRGGLDMIVENTIARCPLPLLTGHNCIDPANDFLADYVTRDERLLIQRDYTYQHQVRAFLVPRKSAVLVFYSKVYNVHRFLRNTLKLTATCWRFRDLIPWGAIFWNLYGALASKNEWTFPLHALRGSCLFKMNDAYRLGNSFARPQNIRLGLARLFSTPTWARDVMLPKRDRKARRQRWLGWSRNYLRRVLVLAFNAPMEPPHNFGARLVSRALEPDYPAIRKQLQEENAMLERRTLRMCRKRDRRKKEKLARKRARSRNDKHQRYSLVSLIA